MVDEKIMKQANSVYETICKSLDARDWKYKRFDEDLTISCGARGDDLPMDIVIVVNPRAQVVSVISPMPYKISEDKRVDGALAVCVANYGLINGSFDYDLSDGEIRFRLVSSFRESILSEELFDYMVMVTASTVDDYNDKFLMISKGMLSVVQFVEWENNRRNG